MKTHIIGGGIIGLCSAWYLQKAGFDVTIIDKNDFTEGCSFGNAGMIVPSHFMPMAAPGVISKGIRWMFDAKSPFYIKPRLNMDLLAWLWRFYRASSGQDIQKAALALRDLSWLSKQLYQELAQEEALKFAYEEQGLMMLFQNKKTAKEEKEVAEMAQALGIKAQILDAEAVSKIETGTRTSVLGGVFYPGDAHLYPNRLMDGMRSQLKKNGATFLSGKTVNAFDYDKEKITHIHTQEGDKIAVNQLIVASGSWTPFLLKKMGIKLLLQDGKGYSITMPNTANRPRIPSILCEAKVAITPMGNDLRIGGTLEISAMKSNINMNRVKGILEPVSSYFPDIQPIIPEAKEVWHGFRPCSPDGLPYIGYSQKFKNLLVANGHAMMGLSLGPATGKVVSELVQQQKTSVNLDLYKVERFG